MTKQERYYSTCGEVFGNVELEDLEIGDHYYSGIKEDIKPSDLISKWTVDTILENMDEALYEEVSELAEGNLHLSEQKNQGLLEIIKYYIDQNATVSCWKVVDIKEHVVEG